MRSLGSSRAVLAGAALFIVPAFSAPPAPADTGLAQAYADFLEAQDLAAQGRLDEARQRLERVLGRDPAAGPARSLLARLCLRSGDLKCAQQNAARVIESDPADAPSHKVLAELAMARYQHSDRADASALQDALNHLARAAESEPLDPTVWVSWIRVLGAEDRVDEAEAIARRAAAVPGLDPVAPWLTIARVLLSRGETDRAIALLEKAEAGGRGAAALLEMLADLKGGKKDFAGQAEAFEKLRALRPGDPGIAHRLGAARLELADPYGALEPLQSAYAALRGDPLVRRDLARALVNLGRGGEALPLLRGIPEVYRSAHTLLLWAQAAEQAGEWAEAAEKLRAAVEGLEPEQRERLEPAFLLRAARNLLSARQPEHALSLVEPLGDDPVVARVRAQALDALGRGAEAEALIAGLKQEHPADAGVLALEIERVARREGEEAALARALSDFGPGPGRYRAAASVAGLLVFWDSPVLAARVLDAVGLPEQPEAELLRARASTLHAAGRLGEAEAAFRRLLEAAPDDDGVMNDLGYLLASQKRSLDEAVRLLQRALEIKPEEPAYLDSLGWALHQSGRSADALPILLRAARGARERDEPDIREHLGDVYWALGQRERARAEWHAALAIGGEGRGRERLEQKLRDASAREQ
ncbi:MAG: tetratricopeptide repeat protein [Acidobacteria bacterium]|nr:tetratricopeptide repeat protein [Acidobacteriota bacterium]